MELTVITEKQRAYSKKYRESEKGKLWRQKNREKTLEYLKNWREQHKDTSEYKEKNRENGRKWFEANKEYRRTQIRKYDRSRYLIRKQIGQSYEGKYQTLRLRHGKRWQEEMITLETFKQIASLPCTYCGLDANKGIDRVDNQFGYTKENSVSCCKNCNYMKNKLSLQEFKDHIMKVYKKICE